MAKLSQSTIEKLDYYVYLLIDPRTDKIFYVGKGRGQRVNQHVLGALKTDLDEVAKIKTIHDIEKAGLEVQHKILRHGLDEQQAFEVESAAIDLIGIKNLTNLVSGHNASDRGLMSLKDIEIMYQAEPAKFDESALLININDKYIPGMNPKEIYEATRKSWDLNADRAATVKVICATYKGIIRGVFIAERWLPDGDHPGRSYFEGAIAPPAIRDRYLHKSAAQYVKPGSRNPIRYVG